MSRVFYRIHYYRGDRQIVARGRWTWNDASKFLRRLGYVLDEKYQYRKPTGMRAEIIGFNGIPF